MFVRPESIVIPELESEILKSRFRELTPFWKWVLIAFSAGGIFMAVYQTFRLNYFGIVVMDTSYYYLMIAFFMSIAFIVFPVKKGATNKKLFHLDIFLFSLTAAISFYLAYKGMDIRNMGWGMIAPAYIVILATLLWILMMESGRRGGGLILMAVVLVFSLFPVIAGHMPGVLAGIQFTIDRTITYHILSSESALGIPLRVFSDLVIGFIVFGVALQATGGGRFFINLALALLGKTRGGTAKVAVMSSALFGSMSGSVISNVLTTGSFTIPAMKKSGYSPEYAGAIEACASTGGVLMPPVMGAVAFILATFVGVPYLTVVVAAAVPSILYYLGLFTQVDGYAAQNRLHGLSQSEIPPLLKTLKSGWLYILAFIVLLAFLFLRREAQAPFVASVIMLVFSIFSTENRLSWAKITRFFEESGKLLSELVAVVALVGMILGALSMTGVAQALSGGLVKLAGGSLPLLLLFGAMASFVLGMGMTITACYVFLAIVLVPALSTLGLNMLAVHLFVMYCGMFSYITPPVALGAFAGATLAGASQMRTGLTATRIGGIIYILPFLFVLRPALLLEASALENLRAIALAVPGVILISSALQGYLIGIGSLQGRGGLSNVFMIIIRLLLVGAGILMVFPGAVTDFTGLGIAIVVIALLILRKVMTKRASI